MTHNYDKQIDRIINYILSNLRGDLSLDKLAALANYSPFHFQKVFKQVVGKTPKQFIMLTKLRSAIGFLIVDNPKPVSEIAFDCGFSSPSVFARSFKDYFGLSAEKLRTIPVEDKIKLISCDSFVKELMHHECHTEEIRDHRHLDVSVRYVNSIHGIFTNTSLQNKEVVNGFRRSVQVAEISDGEMAANRFIGIIYPHHDLYRAFLSIDPTGAIITNENYTEIKSGRYATFKVKGQIEETFVAMNSFYTHWLPHSGYRLADIYVFEALSQNPIRKMYSEIEREIHVPIEPV